MQSNKASKKTSRGPRSSKSKMQETNEIASASHRHKTISSVPEDVVEPTSAQVEAHEADNKSMAAAVGVANIADPVGTVTAAEPNRAASAAEVNPAKVAELAYSYFVARGYQHGHAEEDWLRAERELQSSHSA